MAAKILLLDNNLRVLGLVSERLTYLGYEVVTASRVHDAVLKGIVMPPDLLVCDVLMPELNGWELKRLLAQIPSLAAVPILFLSAHETLPVEMYHPTVGIVDLLKKPYTGEALVAAVGTLIARQAGRRRLMTQPLTGTVALDGATLIDLCHVLALRSADGTVTLSVGAAPSVTAAQWVWSRGALIDAAMEPLRGEEAFLAAMTAAGVEPTVRIDPNPAVPPRPTITKTLAALIAESIRRRVLGEGDPSGARELRTPEPDDAFLERLAATGLILRLGAASSRR